MKKFKWFLLFLILSLAFLLGARMILAGDFFYLFDQARDSLLTQSIVQTHSLALIGTHSGLGGFFHGPLWLYMLAPIYILGKGNPFTFTYFYISLQLFTVFAAYLIGSKLYGNKGGLLISLLIALSPVTWSNVSNTIGVNVEPLVFLGLFYFLVKFIRGEKNAFIFAAFLAGLTLQFETALPLILMPLMVIAFFFNKKSIKDLRLIVLSLISLILSLSSFILFDLRHKFLMTSAVISSLTANGPKGKEYLDFKDRIPSHFNSLLGAYKSVLFNENILLVLLFVAILFFGAFLFLKTKNKHRKEFFFLLLFPILAYVLFMGYAYPIFGPYVLGLVVPVALAFYLAICEAWKKFFGKVLVVLFFALTFLSVAGYIQNQYLTKYQFDSSAGTYKNQLAMVEWIYRDAESNANARGTISAEGTGSRRFGYFVYSTSTYTHGPDYLIAWYGKSHQSTVFESKKHIITYLILYPHMDGDNNAYDFWKKNVLHTQGKVTESKIFPSGITVEKLLIENPEPLVDPNYYQGLLFR
jgi:hypothetical protein